MARQIDADTQVSLIMRIRDREDDSAWRVFVDVYSPLLYGFCRMKGLQASDAADVTQESLIRVTKGIQSFEYDRSKGAFRDWLATIVYNEIRRHVAKSTTNWETIFESDVPDDGTGSQWKEHFQRHVFETALQRCKNHFEQTTWQLFEHSWLKGEAIDQVAEKFSVGSEKIYVARSRVLKRLKTEVANLADDVA